MGNARWVSNVGVTLALFATVPGPRLLGCFGAWGAAAAAAAEACAGNRKLVAAALGLEEHPLICCCVCCIIGISLNCGAEVACISGGAESGGLGGVGAIGTCCLRAICESPVENGGADGGGNGG